MWLFFISLLIIFEFIADIIAKEYQIHSGWIRIAAAVIAYTAANTFWLIALKHGASLSRGAIIFSVCSAALAIIVGLIMYKEPVTRLQIVGLVLGVGAVILLAWEGD